MNKLKMQSMDVTNSNVEKIRALFPHCVTERRGEDGGLELAVDFEKLQLELSDSIIGEGEERYQFTWPDKRKAIREANVRTTSTLRPCREESVDFDTTENLYIEGDNLEVLKVLRETYLGKVKMIYIDPPYNTGNDFVYNDDFAQGKGEFEQSSGLFDEEGNQTIDPLQRNTESNGRFHTDWLNMMYPRLKVARVLLTEDGVIFISIDENEIENLKKLSSEIFGDQNFIGSISWRRFNSQANIGMFATVKDYILMYAKNYNKVSFGRVPLSETAKKEYQYKDERGVYARRPCIDSVRGHYKYKVTCPNGNTLTDNWTIKEDDFRRLDSENLIHWPANGGNPMQKIYLKDALKKGQIACDFWGSEYGNNKVSVEELKSLFGFRSFDFSKPTLLIYNLLNLGAFEPNAVVLDFFSGSATTAHAVMKLNAEDGGNRKFIMVQLPEKTEEKSEAYKAGYKNICEIGKERIRRAGKKVKEEAGLQGQNLDTGFRVLKLDSSNMEDVYYTPESFDASKLFVDNVKVDRTSEDLLFQVMLELGVELSAKIESGEVSGKEVYFVDDNYLVACFDTDVNEAAITENAKMNPVYFVMRDSSMSSDNVADNFDQIFQHYSKDTVRRIL